MNETKSDDARPPARRGSRRVRLGLVAVALVGLGTAIGVVATEGPSHHGWHAFKAWRHHGPLKSEAEVRERAKHFSEWVLDEVDASDAEREEIDDVIDTFVTNAYPLREQHREHRQALIAELTRDEVRPEALEELRLAQVALVDDLSGEVLEALVAVSGVLDAEQRLALAERMSRHRRHRHH